MYLTLLKTVSMMRALLVVRTSIALFEVDQTHQYFAIAQELLSREELPDADTFPKTTALPCSKDT